MLHPSYTDLMKLVNSEVESGEAPVVNSRYSIVLATSKRARQIIDGAETYVSPKCPKPLSIAIDELNNSKIRILSEEEAAEIEARKAEEAARAAAEAEEALETDSTGGAMETTGAIEDEESRDKEDIEDAGTEDTAEDMQEEAVTGTFREDQAGFVCTVCGYVYEGSTLPAGFICPICGNSKEEEIADTVTATAEETTKAASIED